MHKGKQLTKTQIKENLLYYQKILEEIILNNKKYNRPFTIKLRTKPYKPFKHSLRTKKKYGRVLN